MKVRSTRQPSAMNLWITLALIISLLSSFIPIEPAQAAASLSIVPLTWNVIGLDSNNVNVGPNHFPVGARVCNNGDTELTDITSNFVWDSNDAFIKLRPGSLNTFTGVNSIPSLQPGECYDFYYEVEVTRDAAAYDHARRYHITADSAETAEVSTPKPRELYVEHLISQSRNAVKEVKLDTVSIPNGGTLTLLVGNTYNIQLVGSTATNGYNQLESFINLANTIFRINSVVSTYSVSSLPEPHDYLYADSCGWNNDPLSPTYRSCILSDGKTGGDVTTNYNVTIIGGGGTSQTLSTLLYDFSGSSFHYNADFSSSARYVSIIDPTAFTKAFSPASITAGNTSTLTFTIKNLSDQTLSEVSFLDELPENPAVMVLAGDPKTSHTGCGSPTISAQAGTSQILMTGATLIPKGTCTLSVDVTVPSPGNYTNTSNSLSIQGRETGQTATANLTAVEPGTAHGVCELDLATWTFEQAGISPTNPAPSSGTGSASLNNITGAIESAGNPGNNWTGRGFPKSSTDYSDYFQFNVDTTGYTSIGMSFDIKQKDTKSPKNVQVNYSIDGTNYFTLATLSVPDLNDLNYYRLSITSASTPSIPSGAQYFRIIGNNSQNGGNDSILYLDNVSFTGCGPARQATLSKAFAPLRIAESGISTLTFTITNPNSVNLTAATFTDLLPEGLEVAPDPAASTTCPNAIFAPSAGDSELTFSGGTLPANGSCTATVQVTSNTHGVYPNASSFISTYESGTNTTSTGYGTATLTVLKGPSLAKKFSPNPVYAGQDTTLTFTLSNPNSSILTGAAFTDPLPVGLAVASDPAVYTDCPNASFSPQAGNTSLSFSGDIPANMSCEVKVNVTAVNPGTYQNTTSPLTTSVPGVAGLPAEDSLVVVTQHPALLLTKQVSQSANGPWTKFVTVEPGTAVYYRLTIENIGDVDLQNVFVSDPNMDLSACAFSRPFELKTTDLPATCLVGPTAAQAGDFINTATAQGTFHNTTYTSTSSAEVLGVPNISAPHLTLEKQVGLKPTGPWTSSLTGVTPGADIYYKFTLYNSGDTTLSGLSISDPQVDTASCELIDPLPTGVATVCVVGPLIAQPGLNTNVATAIASLPWLSSNSSDATYTAGGYSLSGVVWEDPNADGLVDPSELRLFNVMLALYLDNGDGIFDAGEDTFLGNQYTGVDGSYSFAELPPGSYFVQVVTGVEGYLLVSGGSNPRLVSITNSDLFGNNFGYRIPTADLAVAKTNGVASLQSGSSTTYTLTVTNLGPEAVTGAILVDAPGAGLTPTSVACSAAVGNQCITAPYLADLTSTGISLPALAKDQFYQLRLTATVTAASGSVTNTASAAVPPGTSDPDDSNNQASDTDTVIPLPSQADLAVAKTDGVASLQSGSSTTYTLTVTNLGPDPVTGAILVDAPGAGLTPTSVACSTAVGNQCNADPDLAELTSTGVSLPALAKDQFYQLRLTARVTVSTGSVTNTATVTPPAGMSDSDLTNNSASDTDAITLYKIYLPMIQQQVEPSTRTWNTVVGYEDLSLVTGKNDFDYNDWSVIIDGSLIFTAPTSNLLQSFSLVFTPRTRGGAYDHTFKIRIPAQTFNSNGTVVINLYDQSHNLLSKQVKTLTSSAENIYVIFPKTSEVFPGSIVNTVEGKPMVNVQRYADLTVTFNTPVPFVFDPDDFSQPHGQNLFFDPTLLVINNGEEIHRGDVRLLAIPSRTYLWPEEGIRIDRAYPLVTYIASTPPDFTFPPSWWTVHNNCVYDGVPCSTP